MNVYLLNIKEGSELCEEKVFSTEGKALQYLSKLVRDMWEGEEHGTSLPEDDILAIARYFEFWTPEMSYSIEEKELDSIVPNV